MFTDEELELEIKVCEQQIAELVERKRKYQGELSCRRSKSYIAAMKINRADVFHSDQDDAPGSKQRIWFGTVWRFAEWIKKQRTKKSYAEWNGQIHLVSELTNGRFAPTPAYWDDVPKE